MLFFPFENDSCSDRSLISLQIPMDTTVFLFFPLPAAVKAVDGGATIEILLGSLMEVVRTTIACECVYVRVMVIKALIWMQNPYDSFDELRAIIAAELSDPAWPSTLLNDVLLTLHARFKVFRCQSSILC